MHKVYTAQGVRRAQGRQNTGWAGHEVHIAAGYTVHKLHTLSTNGAQYIRLHMIHRVHSTHRVHRSLGTHFEFIQL
jgi:hypothetical protein